jgi:alkylation response protein AidB-like acyl-CoA dehydrogenase
MNFAFTAEQVELKREARRFLSTHRDAEWRHVARELGWASLVVPEGHGGAGLGWIELVALAEEAGRVLTSLPLLSTVALATGALLEGGDDAQRAALLPRIARGDATATLAFAEEPLGDPFAIATVARPDTTGYELSGEKRYVLDGHAADVLLVTARTPGTAGQDGVATFVVEAGAAGLERERVPTMDSTRSLAVVKLNGVRVGRDARVGDGATLRRALDRAAVVLAAESLGGAERCLEMAIEHAKSRVQFERPIGSFQAIRHKLADMLMAVETARSAAYYAACVAASREDPELATAAPLAKAYCTEAFFRCANESVQIHGGIGFTWEHEAHLYLKRARGSLALLGSPAADRERLARVMGLEPDA